MAGGEADRGNPYASLTDGELAILGGGGRLADGRNDRDVALGRAAGTPETDSDLLWAAIAGLRADVARLTGRLERMSEPVPAGDAESVAEAWRKVRQEELDRLLKQREAQGKGEELEPDDIEALGSEWMNR